MDYVIRIVFYACFFPTPPTAHYVRSFIYIYRGLVRVYLFVLSVCGCGDFLQIRAFAYRKFFFEKKVVSSCTAQFVRARSRTHTVILEGKSTGV